MTADCPLCAEVAAVRLRPGDTVVVSVPGALAQERREALTRLLKERFPGHEAIVLHGGMRLGVLRPESDAPAYVDGKG